MASACFGTVCQEMIGREQPTAVYFLGMKWSMASACFGTVCQEMIGREQPTAVYFLGSVWTRRQENVLYGERVYRGRRMESW